MGSDLTSGPRGRGPQPRLLVVVLALRVEQVRKACGVSTDRADGPGARHRQQTNQGCAGAGVPASPSPRGATPISGEEGFAQHDQRQRTAATPPTAAAEMAP